MGSVSHKCTARYLQRQLATRTVGNDSDTHWQRQPATRTVGSDSDTHWQRQSATRTVGSDNDTQWQRQSATRTVGTDSATFVRMTDITKVKVCFAPANTTHAWWGKMLAIKTVVVSLLFGNAAKGQRAIHSSITTPHNNTCHHRNCIFVLF